MAKRSAPPLEKQITNALLAIYGAQNRLIDCDYPHEVEELDQVARLIKRLLGELAMYEEQLRKFKRRESK